MVEPPVLFLQGEQLRQVVGRESGRHGLWRSSIPAVALLAGDPEFGVRNVWVWVAGGVRCKRVVHRTTEAGAFFPDWFVWVFAATKRGDEVTSGWEHSEPVSGSSGGSHPGAVPERITLLVLEGLQSLLSSDWTTLEATLECPLYGESALILQTARAQAENL